jgi:crotonobetainyl-CoA:carnitine CoA-transferase CaiB-like acyl-CoA transferase
VTEVEHPLLGKMPIVNTPFQLSETPRQIQGPAPLLGQHNSEVLTQYLGYAAADIARLTQAGVLVEEERVRELREKGVI